MAVWIFLGLPCLILSISIYYAPKSHIRVKSYDHLNFSRASIVQFQESLYIVGLNHTSESKVMAVWIWLALPCWSLSISIYYVTASIIWVKRYYHLILLRAPIFQFLASRYIIGLNWTSESKVMAIWICLSFPCLIFQISIYYAPESNIRVKSYDHLKFLSASVIQFQASRYIVCLNHTSESKVMAIWICLVFPCLIFRIYI